MTVQELMAQLAGYDPDLPVSLEDWQEDSCPAEITGTRLMDNNEYFPATSDTPVRGMFVVLTSLLMEKK